MYNLHNRVINNVTFTFDGIRQILFAKVYEESPIFLWIVWRNVRVNESINFYKYIFSSYLLQLDVTHRLYITYLH